MASEQVQFLGDQLDAAIRDALGEESDARERAAGPWTALDAVLAEVGSARVGASD